jgi:hypothetical protein
MANCSDLKEPHSKFCEAGLKTRREVVSDAYVDRKQRNC